MLDEILNSFEERVKNDQPISATEWLYGSVKLNALRGSLDSEIINLKFSINKFKAELLKESIPSNKAEALSQATEEYKKWEELRAKANRITEFIRISKQISRINEM